MVCSLCREERSHKKCKWWAKRWAIRRSFYNILTNRTQKDITYSPKSRCYWTHQFMRKWWCRIKNDFSPCIRIEGPRSSAVERPSATSLSSSIIVSRILATFCRATDTNSGGATVAYREGWALAIGLAVEEVEVLWIGNRWRYHQYIDHD